MSKPMGQPQAQDEETSLGISATFCVGMQHVNWLVVEPTPLKNIKSIGMMTLPIDGKIIQMFQTTNQ